MIPSASAVTPKRQRERLNSLLRPLSRQKSPSPLQKVKIAPPSQIEIIAGGSAEKVQVFDQNMHGPNSDQKFLGVQELSPVYLDDCVHTQVENS